MLSQTAILFGVLGYIVLLVLVCLREVRIRKRKRAERREAIRLEQYQEHMELVHDEQGIQRDGQEAG